MKLIWIGLFFLIAGCYTQSMTAPRSATESGSKQLLNSYAIVAPSFQIIQYDNNLAWRNTYYFKEGGWLAVVACDHYYLALSNVEYNVLALHLFTPFNSTAQDLNHTVVFSNITTPGNWYTFISVAPSGSNFVFLNGLHLLVFEVDLQTFNSTMTVEKPVDAYIPTMRGRLVMSDSKISFIFNTTDQYIYDYKSHETTVRTLPSAWQINAYDTYDDYWVYASNKDILLEDPTGNLHVFNYTEVFVVERVSILPPQLRAAPDSIDVALISGYVVLGTLNAATRQFDKYSSVPSKSIGLGYKQQVADVQHEGLLNFVVGYNVILYELSDPGRTIGISVPALPGNHSCSMRRGDRMNTFWCGNGGTDPTYFCPAGTYQPARGFASCLLCPEGTYQPNEGSVNCLACKDTEYCPLGTVQPSTIDPNSVGQESWTFPVSETVTSFEEVLLMLMFASSLSNIAIVLWGLFGITAALILSLLLKYFTGINIHKWLAKIDIHKKTRYKARPKPNGGFKIEPVKVESVFGGYLTLLAGYILLVGLITTISYVRDYHPLLIGQDESVNPSENSARESLVQDYNTQSEASYLANVIKNNLSINVTVHMYNFQSFVFPGNGPLDGAILQNCYNPFGEECEIAPGERLRNSTGDIKVQMHGPLRFTQAELDITTSFDSYFTFAIVEISVASLRENNMTGIFQPSKVNYLVLPGKDRVITGVLLIPITMTVVIRETELSDEDFQRVGYMSFVSDESKLQNMGHSIQTFEKTFVSPSFEFQLTMDNNWRLESEQRRFSGVGAFFAALLAILGLYEVTLLASELAHRIFHAIEKRHKKRSKYETLLEDPTSVLIVNEKAE